MNYSKDMKKSNRCVRKGFNKNGGVICSECFKKDRVIENLREKIKTLESKIRFFDKKKKVAKKDLATEPHKPSSRVDYKANSKEDNRKKSGGGKPGHKGHGREHGDTSQIELINAPKTCPCCNLKLSLKDTKARTFVDIVSIKAKRKVLGLRRGQCPGCKKVYKPKVDAFPRSMYGNQLISHAAVMHYVHGVPIGRLIEIFGPDLKQAGLINAFHNLSKLCEKARPNLIEDYRKSHVRHADETGWRTDGFSGYAWIFNTDKITLFDLRDTRAAIVPQAIFGDKKLEGVLVVDRYNGYNKLPVKIQYCYAHLLREVASLEKEFGGDKEVEMFTNRMCSLISDAIKLRRQPLSDRLYLQQAKEIKRKLLREVSIPYQHLGIKWIQQIFNSKKHRMYHWATDPKIPADNNRAEREIRSTVIARKSSFGSQSTLGARTRSNIMSVLLTAKKRLRYVALEEWFFNSINQISRNPDINIYNLIPP